MDKEIHDIQHNMELSAKEKFIKIQELMKTNNAQFLEKTIENKENNVCEHYKRNLILITPCCEKEYGCHKCHDKFEDHELNRPTITTILCKECKFQQKPSDLCLQCGISFGKYSCTKCMMWSEFTDIWHCDDCDLCNKGDIDEYVHCHECGYCVRKESIEKNTHIHRSQLLDELCCVCNEKIFKQSIPAFTALCSHSIHHTCLNKMLQNNNISCPLCRKTMVIIDWTFMVNALEEQPMPEDMKKKVEILCQDCEKTSTADFHFIGHQCGECKSFNTILK